MNRQLPTYATKFTFTRRTLHINMHRQSLHSHTPGLSTLRPRDVMVCALSALSVRLFDAVVRKGVALLGLEMLGVVLA